MNHYGPRVLSDEDGRSTGKFHYARSSRYLSEAVGYCADGCGGHETAAEAREHYRQFLVNERVSLFRGQMQRPERCKACGSWTRSFARIEAWDYYPLCEEHLSRETVDRLLGEVPDFVTAW